MNYESDLFLKDEGEMITVCFQTPKAIEVLSRENADALKQLVYGGDNYKKLDINNDDKMVAFFLNYAKSHSLTLDKDF